MMELGNNTNNNSTNWVGSGSGNGSNKSLGFGAGGSGAAGFHHRNYYRHNPMLPSSSSSALINGAGGSSSGGLGGGLSFNNGVYGGGGGNVVGSGSGFASNGGGGIFGGGGGWSVEERGKIVEGFDNSVASGGQAISFGAVATSSNSNAFGGVVVGPGPGPGPGQAGAGIIDRGGLAVDWSVEEQLKLVEGLDKYGNESSIMKYIKVAATLREKTVRDVALRCRWMINGKRRKQGRFMDKKMNSGKEIMPGSSFDATSPPVPPLGMTSNSFMPNHLVQNERVSSEVPILSSTTRHLLDENGKAFSQIAANLETHKVHDNIDLLCRTRNNIRTILNDMREMPGVMSQMRPLPVSLNEELANVVLFNTSQQRAAFLPNGIHLKQEPRC